VAQRVSAALVEQRAGTLRYMGPRVPARCPTVLSRTSEGSRLKLTVVRRIRADHPVSRPGRPIDVIRQLAIVSSLAPVRLWPTSAFGLQYHVIAQGR
jgi:hypothetical protein